MTLEPRVRYRVGLRKASSTGGTSQIIIYLQNELTQLRSPFVLNSNTLFNAFRLLMSVALCLTQTSLSLRCLQISTIFMFKVIFLAQKFSMIAQYLLLQLHLPPFSHLHLHPQTCPPSRTPQEVLPLNISHAILSMVFSLHSSGKREDSVQTHGLLFLTHFSIRFHFLILFILLYVLTFIAPITVQ